MGRKNHVQNNLNGGVWGRQMYGRDDLDKYGDSVRVMHNWVPIPQGGATHRVGTVYSRLQGNQGADSRLLKFQFSTEQSYTLEMYWNDTDSEGRVRFCKDLVWQTHAELPVANRTFGTAGVDITLNELEVTGKHYLRHLQPIKFTNPGGDTDLPLGLDQATTYYVVLEQPLSWTNAEFDDTTEKITQANNYENVGAAQGQGPYRLTTTGSLPDGGTGEGLDTNTDYYIWDSNGSQFGLTLDAVGADRDFDATGTDGTHTLTPTTSYIRTKFRVATSLSDPYGNIVDLQDVGANTHTIVDPVLDPIELVVPYTASEMQDLQEEQTPDVLYIAHNSHPLSKISRYGHAAWEFDNAVLKDGPYLWENEGEQVENTRMFFTGGFDVGNDEAGGSRLVVDVKHPDSSAAVPLFAPSDVGRFIRMQHLESGLLKWGYVEIREYVSESIVRVNVKPNPTERTGLGNGGEAERWRLGAFGSDLDNLGYPGVLVRFDQRLGIANHAAAPNGFYGSRVVEDGYENFSPSEVNGQVFENAALRYLLGDNGVDAIRWAKRVRSLIIGTSDTIAPIEATTFLDPITPANVQSRPSTATGTGSMRPVVDSDAIYYATKTNRSIMSVGYQFEKDTYGDDDVSIETPGLIRPGVLQSEVQREPDRLLWFRKSDGNLIAITRVAEQGIKAWHSHQLGGSFGGSNPFVGSMVSVPSPDETHDKMWFAVKRTINGATVRSLEYTADPFYEDSLPEDAYFVDMGYSYDGAPTTTIAYANISHLEQETVDIVADGGWVGTFLVDGVDLEIPAEASKIHVGLYSDADIEPLDMDGADRAGKNEGHLRRIHAVFLNVMSSAGLRVGVDSDALDVVLFDHPEDADPNDLYDGDVEIPFEGDWGRRTKMLIRQDKPLPATILQIISEVEVSER